MRSHCTPGKDPRRRVNVIQQDPDPHAALGSGNDAQQKQVGRQIITDAEVLQVERALGRFRQRGARHEGSLSCVHDLKAGHARIPGRLRRKNATEDRVIPVGNRL